MTHSVSLEHARTPTPAHPAALHGADDGVHPLEPTDQHGRLFSGPYAHVVVPGAGNNLLQDKPEAVVAAILGLVSR